MSQTGSGKPLQRVPLRQRLKKALSFQHWLHVCASLLQERTFTIIQPLVSFPRHTSTCTATYIMNPKPINFARQLSEALQVDNAMFINSLPIWQLAIEVDS